jgi:hypothetical protein
MVGPWGLGMLVGARVPILRTGLVPELTTNARFGKAELEFYQTYFVVPGNLSLATDCEPARG